MEETFHQLDEMMQTDEGKEELATLHTSGENVSFAGCTATMVLITRTEVYCANAGDSRTVLAHRGHAKDLSVDHKPEDEVELARIENSGNYVSSGRINGKLALSRSLGDFEYKNNGDITWKD